jgi:glyoxylase-like metal-dependent hydrolase (beta-lactamase superfamily II)
VGRDAAVPLAPGVWRIPTMARSMINTFAFRDGDGSVTLVDAGMRWALRRTLAGLAAIGAAPTDVRRVVLTHAHIDHAGGLRRLVKATGADIASHEREAPYLRDGRAPRAGRRGHGQRIGKVTVAEEFIDGALLPVAGGLRVIHTPGHTPGHVSLLHEPTGVLITGDAVLNLRAIRYAPARFCTDSELNRKACDRLGELDYEVVAFSHGPEIRDGAREAVRAFLRGRAR